MEIYDIAMLIVLFGAMVFGAIKGFAWQLASIASIVLSYLVAYKYREPFSESIQAEPPWNRFLAMLILFVGTSLVIWVAFRMIRGTIDRLKLREFDRQIGALFGLAKGALYCILITFFAVTLCGDRIGEAIVRSKSGRYISQVLDRSEAVIPAEIHDVVQPYLDKFENSLQEAKPGLLNRVPWLAEEETAPIEQATQWLPQQPFNSSGESPLPVDPNQWLPSNQNLAPQQPQQAQQPVWNGYQR
ncbi:MAG: CvpA family protein [Rubripirellula sp.]|nr:CvpA family protein [Rubripirellula sp.]